LVDALAHGAGARVCAGNDPDNRIGGDDFKNVGRFHLDAPADFFLRVHGWEMRSLWRIFHDQRHANTDYERNASRNPE